MICSTLSGLARSVSQLVQVLRDYVTHGIFFIVPGRINTSKASSKAFLNLLDAIEEFKRAAATENIREGLIAARKRGVKLGRPETVSVHRENVARLRARGLTGRAIAKELGLRSSSVFKIIGQFKN